MGREIIITYPNVARYYYFLANWGEKLLFLSQMGRVTKIGRKSSERWNIFRSLTRSPTSLSLARSLTRANNFFFARSFAHERANERPFFARERERCPPLVRTASRRIKVEYEMCREMKENGHGIELYYFWVLIIYLGNMRDSFEIYY